MNISSIKLYSFLLLFAFVIQACSIIDDDDLSNTNIVAIRTGGWIHSELILEGSGLDANCDNTTMSISNGTTTLPLDINDCTSSSITGWIPQDATPGTYNITVDINGNSFTSIDGVNMQVNVKNRPVILSMSKTTMQAGETITIEGLHLINMTTTPQYDAKVWIMGNGYTNTVSDISVDSDGQGATIEIDDGIPSGQYDFLITTEEWSNTIIVTIL